MNNDILFQVVDEIDHFTLKYRQKGIFDCKKANEMIRKYSSYYKEAAALNFRYRNEEELKNDGMIQELYDELISLRTVLLEKSFE